MCGCCCDGLVPSENPHVSSTHLINTQQTLQDLNPSVETDGADECITLKLAPCVDKILGSLDTQTADAVADEIGGRPVSFTFPFHSPLVNSNW